MVSKCGNVEEEEEEEGLMGEWNLGYSVRGEDVC